MKEFKNVELNGSEKQIAWAANIRENLKSVYRRLEDLKFTDGKIMVHNRNRDVLTGAIIEFDRPLDIVDAQRMIEEATRVYMAADHGYGQAFRDAATSAGLTESSDKTEILKEFVSVMMNRICVTVETETSAKTYIDNYRDIDVESMGLF